MHFLPPLRNALLAATLTPHAVIPAKEFDAARTLELMTLHSSSALVATGEQVAALEAALAADAAKPAGKRAYNLGGLRSGLVGELSK